MQIGVAVHDDSTYFAYAKVKRSLEGSGFSIHPVLERTSSSFKGDVVNHLMTDVDARYGLDNESDLGALLDALLIPKPTDWTLRLRSGVPKVGIFTGVDFRPKKGVENRHFCDAAIYTTAEQSDIAKEINPDQIQTWYQPTYLPSADCSQERICSLDDLIALEFYTQEKTPRDLEGRRYILDLLASVARMNPQLMVVVKERLPAGVEGFHADVGRYSSLWLDKYGDEGPANLTFSTDHVDVPNRPGSVAGISCSSTALLSLAGEGSAIGVISEFPGALNDRFRSDALAYWAEAGVTTSARQLLDGVIHRPEQNWMERHFRTEGFGEILTQLLRQLGKG